MTGAADGPASPGSPAGVPAALLAKPDYGAHIRKSEAAAMAAYIEANQRVPRRGEVGWTADDIEKLEGAGYVMSGSRHKRMNEVRLRKENQVYTAEEKRALALYNFEQKQAREAAIMEEFKAIVASKAGGGAGDGGEAPK